MKALAIDTSTFVLGVALVDGDKVLGELTTNLKKNHSLRLMPAIHSIMNDAGVSPKELNRIVVAEGPGSYTGVRIGVTTAKTLAWTLGIPLIGVSSLEVLAQNGRHFNGVVSPIFDARRGQVYTGLYGVKNKVYTKIVDDQICLLEDWVTLLNEKYENVLFLGNDIPIHKHIMEEELGNKVQFGLLSDHNSRPSELARLGLLREPNGHIHDFTPNYIRLAEAEVNWLKEQKNNS
ncbi:tRNA (adenosine(37)-N6)-threonylcarbamoyltransferase complex dimerization subunit type 1 TsaB [Anaerobacillus alkalidiazotrophicus]|uniref:tRNA (Adenosine(37)-N6)-threonylcarbamoyltransferase complex dimerization subunit type 1 TsaB n=1 Tax=Anaerobacillus alkalidiazotrophicus TaxID=472963 RepID=A0A1S2LWN5_9BACI|nr:tRNA (adenosine(37)-N6)-threonylcarbamoyltransferase complex dimerization subunit type 1 TsaB [Anaerobacillus alkalidiazotrophicus]OIJ16952.1 tRNA (adenosine(37)-N6)-threonylcarbamoyltransferase complex dimerization subunit type 1 TsaB [Anaerobacillus alkalidiazotrophicus]